MPKLNNDSTKANINSNKEQIKEIPTLKIENENPNYNSEIQKLKEQNEMLTTQLAQLMDIFQKLDVSNTKSSPLQVENDDLETNIMKDIETKYTYLDIPQEVNPNKQIMVMSLCYGSLNLSDDSTGKTVLRFSRYGESKPVLYSTLINIVNSNRRFAETGKFYILDKDAVYHLGLSEFYKNLISKDIIDNILNYSPNIIESVVKSIELEQRELLSRTLCDRVYNGEDIDINKIIFIGKACNIDIMKKVEEMKQYDANKK